MFFAAPRSVWDAGGTWIVCSGTPELWIGEDTMYGKTRGALTRKFFAPQCRRGRNSDTSEVRCGVRGARPYSEVPLNFRYLELMHWRGWTQVENRCRAMAQGHAWDCYGRSRKNWTKGWRSALIISDNG